MAAALLARSSASAAFVSARGSSQAEQQPKRSVSTAAWQKAITEQELEKADVSFHFLLSFSFDRNSGFLSSDRNW